MLKLEFPPNVGGFYGAPIKYKGEQFYARILIKKVENDYVYVCKRITNNTIFFIITYNFSYVIFKGILH